MNTRHLLHAAALPLAVLGLLRSLTAPAADPPAATPPTSAVPKSTAAAAVTTNAAPVIRFRPLTKGAPKVRLTGGSRGTGDAAVTLDVLAPDDVGLTTREQPSLFWYQSRPSSARFELTLLRDREPQPLLRITAEHAASAGIQRLDLSRTDVRLQPGVEYQWVVALVTDPENRSTDLVASGFIRRVEPDAELGRKLGSAGAESRPAVYAEGGIWYDALATLADDLAARPDHPELNRARADLLGQVGLKAAEEFERKQARR